VAGIHVLFWSFRWTNDFYIASHHKSVIPYSHNARVLNFCLFFIHRDSFSCTRSCHTLLISIVPFSHIRGPHGVSCISVLFEICTCVASKITENHKTPCREVEWRGGWLRWLVYQHSNVYLCAETSPTEKVGYSWYMVLLNHISTCSNYVELEYPIKTPGMIACVNILSAWYGWKMGLWQWYSNNHG